MNGQPSDLQQERAEVGKYDIDPAAIAPKVSQQLLHDVVVMYQANKRLGTHKSKTRGEVRGTTKKMYRQKGTGNARAGSRRSPLRRGGGHVFALRNRDYSYRLPKKAIQSATRMAIVKKIESHDLVVIDELSFKGPKTKEMAGILKALKLDGKRTLVTTAASDVNAYRECPQHRQDHGSAGRRTECPGDFDAARNCWSARRPWMRSKSGGPKLPSLHSRDHW